jgi:hypothetical protein
VVNLGEEEQESFGRGDSRWQRGFQMAEGIRDGRCAHRPDRLLVDQSATPAARVTGEELSTGQPPAVGNNEDGEGSSGDNSKDTESSTVIVFSRLQVDDFVKPKYCTEESQMGITSQLTTAATTDMTAAKTTAK